MSQENHFRTIERHLRRKRRAATNSDPRQLELPGIMRGKSELELQVREINEKMSIIRPLQAIFDDKIWLNSVELAQLAAQVQQRAKLNPQVVTLRYYTHPVKSEPVIMHVSSRAHLGPPPRAGTAVRRWSCRDIGVKSACAAPTAARLPS